MLGLRQVGLTGDLCRSGFEVSQCGTYHECSGNEAEKQRLLNEAYQGVGADRLVGLQWAKVLSGIDTIVLQSGGPGGFNPLDMESLMKQLKLKPLESK